MRLACGHVIGSECLEEWVGRLRGETCPVCRAGLEVVLVRVEGGEVGMGVRDGERESG